MAPNNFDKQIHKLLEKRSIEPSADAWSKLESQLDKQEETSNKFRPWWFAVAASLIAIALFWFNNERTATNPNKQQQVEVNSLPIEVETPSIQNEQPEAIIIVSDTNLLAEEQVINEKEIINDLRQQPEHLKQTNKELIDEFTVAKEPKSLVPSLIENSLQQQHIEAVVAQMKAIDSTDHWSIENEVDALLAEAQRKIKLEKLFNEAIHNIDSNALLKEVEEDIDESFRTKVFDALKASYKTVKTAVAERNN